MPRGYWCIILAAFGWLSAAQAQPRQNGEGEQAQAEQIRDAALQNIAAALQEANEPNQTVQPCEYGQDDRYSDLCAQWKAADAAWSGANATWLFGGLGTLIGLITMGAAIAAAKFARDAATHTSVGAVEAKRSADAAHAANRPWLVVTITPDFVSTVGTPTFSLMLSIKNIGRTPAQNVRYEAEIIEGGKHGGDHEFFHEPHRGKDWPRPCRAVLPDGEFSDQELVFTTWAALQNVGNIALIGVNVTYELPDGADAQTSVSCHVGMIGDDPDRLSGIFPDMGSTEGRLRAVPGWFEKYT